MYDFSVNLAEITSALEALSRADQEDLLHYLQAKLEQWNWRNPPSTEEWLRELDALRASLSTGRCGISSEQIINELRGDLMVFWDTACLLKF